MKSFIFSLFFFTTANLAAEVTFAQLPPQDTSTVKPTAATPEDNQVSKSMIRRIGPYVKNPHAAGRAGYKGDPEQPIALPSRQQLYGPQYKNQTWGSTSEADTVTQDTPRKQLLYGPRYKNRSAKSGG